MPETDNDPSASTASFRAFADRSDEDLASARQAPVSRGVIIAVAIVCVLIVIGVIVAVA
jgi:hypothetical protein